MGMQVADLNVPYILMHMRGTPQTMQQHTQYSDTCMEVGQELQQQANKAVDAGIEPWRILLDPGLQGMQPCTSLLLSAHILRDAGLYAETFGCFLALCYKLSF